MKAVCPVIEGEVTVPLSDGAFASDWLQPPPCRVIVQVFDFTLDADQLSWVVELRRTVFGLAERETDAAG